jgi:flagellar biosynthesis protein FlhG
MNTGALDQAATLRRLVAEKQGHRTPVLAIASGKGGAGKTLLSINLALEMASRGRRVLLIDLDPGLANVEVHLRLPQGPRLSEVLTGQISLEEAYVESAFGLKLLGGGHLSSLDGDEMRDELPHLGSAQTPHRILELVRRSSERFDVILLDAGAGLGPWVRQTLCEADQAILVTQPDPASVTDAYALLKLCQIDRLTCTSSLFVNRAKDREEALLTATRLRSVALRFLGLEPELQGWFLEDPAIAASTQHQVPFRLQLPPEAPSRRSLSSLAATLLAKLPLAIQGH